MDYLPPDTLLVLDEPEACQGHSDRWVEHVEQDFQSHRDRHPDLSPLHRSIQESLGACPLDRVDLRELVLSDREVQEQPGKRLNLASRRLPSTPHQFAKIAQILREERDRGFNIFLISAQPSRTVALLQEHDCNAQFLPNPRDYPAVDRLQTHHVPIALKYAGQAELEGFILPTLRLVIVSDREFFGQHSLASPSYVRKRRRAASKQVDPNQLQPGDYVVHQNHGIGQFLQLESLTLNGETREYLVLRYADGTLRVAADQLNALSRYRHTGSGHPQLNKMSGKAWERTKKQSPQGRQKRLPSTY